MIAEVLSQKVAMRWNLMVYTILGFSLFIVLQTENSPVFLVLCFSLVPFVF